jgi:hypothetical protein
MALHIKADRISFRYKKGKEYFTAIRVKKYEILLFVYRFVSTQGHNYIYLMEFLE